MLHDVSVVVNVNTSVDTVTVVACNICLKCYNNNNIFLLKQDYKIELAK